jgi:hypothetical protein
MSEMATARCETCGPPQGLKYNYPHRHTFAPPRTILCGAPGCIHPARAWLTDEEERFYLSGERVFRLVKDAVDVTLV